MSHTKGMAHVGRMLTLLPLEVLSAFLLCDLQHLDLVKVSAGAVYRVWLAFCVHDTHLRPATNTPLERVTFRVHHRDIVLGTELALLDSFVLAELDT